MRPYVCYDQVDEPQQGLCLVSLQGRYGYIDLAGKVCIPAVGRFVFDEAFSFGPEGLACVRVEGRYGYINGEGKTVIPIDYDSIGFFGKGGLIPVRKGGKAGALRADGSVAIPLLYSEIHSFEGEAFSVGDGHRYALADREGRLLTPFHFEQIFEHVYYFSENLAPARKQGLWGFVDMRTGDLVVEALYDEVGRFKEGHALVRKGKEVLFIDREGARLTSISIEQAKEFSEGLAAVRSGGLWGYIDLRGKWDIEPAYQEAGDFSDGFAGVKRGGDWITIDATNNPATRPAPAPAAVVPGYIERVSGPTRCTVNYEHLNLGLSMLWEGGGRASEVRVFELATNTTLAWDATLEEGRLFGGLYVREGTLILLDPKRPLSLFRLREAVDTALQERARLLAAEAVAGDKVARDRLVATLKTVLTEMEKADAELTKHKLLRFRFDADASNPTEEMHNRLRDARACVQQVRALSALIDRAYREHPVMNAEQRALLKSIQQKQAAALQRVLGIQ